ncbi:uncharacterized protein G2W53_029073 [Senna tora]|uniref:Uncharacterized protein n=1 Tax=Senna tora TaxID=362788 RepID=A0A834WFD9_9FABA|nr:uncharacterized protein G2W53_029073 [Senna tora]
MIFIFFVPYVVVRGRCRYAEEPLHFRDCTSVFVVICRRLTSEKFLRHNGLQRRLRNTFKIDGSTEARHYWKVVAMEHHSVGLLANLGVLVDTSGHAGEQVNSCPATSQGSSQFAVSKVELGKLKNSNPIRRCQRGIG